MNAGAATRSWKGKGTDSIIETSKEQSLPQNLDFRFQASRIISELNLWFQAVKFEPEKTIPFLMFDILPIIIIIQVKVYIVGAK